MKKALIWYCLIHAIFFVPGLLRSQQKEFDTQRLKSAEEILYIAQKGYGIRSGDAMTLPMPTKVGQQVYIIILYYREGMRPGQEIIYPPHHKVLINAASGKVIENSPIRPGDLGVPMAPGTATKGFGLDPKMTPDEFWNLFDRFYFISPTVWEIYQKGNNQLSAQDLKILQEYNSIFYRIGKKPSLPYYTAIASDFLNWLAEVSANTSDRKISDSSRAPTDKHDSGLTKISGSKGKKTTVNSCTSPPIVERTNLTPDEKRMLIMRITTDMDSVKGELFLPLFLDAHDLPGYLKMIQDTRRHLPLEPDDAAFAKHCGFSSGLALWEGGFAETIWRLVDIRSVFPTARQAQAYLTERMSVMSEGQAPLPEAPEIGTGCKVFGGTTDVQGTPLTHYYYLFSVQNVVVKLYAAQGPEVSSHGEMLTIKTVAALAEKCLHRIETYNREARKEGDKH